MAVRKDWVLQQAIVDVQYDRGFVYFDKCGALTLSLQDALGKSFEATIPTVTSGELRNTAERVAVTFGLKAVNVQQQWAKTPVRAEHVASVSWELVSDMLDVARSVTRVGVRHVFWAGADTKDEVQDMFKRSQFATLAPELRQLAGSAAIQACSVVLDEDKARVRVAAEQAEVTLVAQLVEELMSLIPPHAFVLDVDSVMSGSIPQLSKAELRDFTRNCWQRSRGLAMLVGERIGMDRA